MSTELLHKTLVLFNRYNNRTFPCLEDRFEIIFVISHDVFPIPGCVYDMVPVCLFDVFHSGGITMSWPVDTFHKIEISICIITLIDYWSSSPM